MGSRKKVEALDEDFVKVNGRKAVYMYIRTADSRVSVLEHKLVPSEDSK